MTADSPLLLSSKLQAPKLRDGILPRPELTSLIADGLADGRLIGFVCAPAGAGKTTLIATYLARHPPASVGWFHVDRGDNDPARFWAHLAAAASANGAGGDGRVPADLLAGIRAGNWLSVAASVATALEEVGDAVVVIDDYHHITSSPVHEHVDLLLQWLPPSSRLVVSTRADPPLPSIARLRVQGQLVEIRADDLAFDVEQGLELLEASTTVAIDAADAAKLVERTEGWAAGLYLAALSIERHNDAAAVVARFDGDDRLMADYLRSEFLRDLGDETRRFMLRSSILDELSGPLCAAVTGIADSADRLRELERANLLLVPMDTVGEWYRFHHLLASWLRAELEQTEPELVPDLHRRAATWLHEHGRTDVGIGHALAAGDDDLAVDLVNAAWHDRLLAGQVFTVRDWFNALDPDVVASRPAMAAAMARIHLNTGRPPGEVEEWLDRAVAAAPAPDGHVDVDRVWALYQRQIGDLTGAERRARAVLDTVTSATIEDHTLLGSILHLTGQLDEAQDRLAMAVDGARVPDDALDFHLAQGHLAAVAYELGHRRQAKDRATEVVTSARTVGLERWPTLVVANYVLGLVALDDLDLPVAEASLTAAFEAAERARYVPMQYLVLTALSRLRVLDRHQAQARRLAEQARRVLDAMPAADRLATLAATAHRPRITEAAAPVDHAIVEDLTDRELAVLRLLATDLALREVGAELYVSHNTVKGHAKAIYRKLAVHSRATAVARARELGLL